MKINASIVGLGRVGSILLQQLYIKNERGINIVAVAEIQETPGKIFARDHNIKISSIEEIAEYGEKIDLIFELTGNSEVRRQMRNLLKEKNNNHTVIATETVAILICLMLSDKELPGVHEHIGYWLFL